MSSAEFWRLVDRLQIPDASGGSVTEAASSASLGAS
jgi:hypothetical protein